MIVITWQVVAILDKWFSSSCTCAGECWSRSKTFALMHQWATHLFNRAWRNGPIPGLKIRQTFSSYEMWFSSLTQLIRSLIDPIPEVRSRPIFSNDVLLTRRVKFRYEQSPMIEFLLTAFPHLPLPGEKRPKMSLLLTHRTKWAIWRHVSVVLKKILIDISKVEFHVMIFITVFFIDDQGPPLICYIIIQQGNALQ